ncbi:hypothetical protein [Oceanospirillum maris]|jgi:Spy/CpxP family protein refolding chaperone|uniref:hypothetical protein n=1 Tax=Oceanospirillum maris TaxID=64977 RepID=UPI0003FB95AE|nr:hypothetical protein [Oceanospirillum maris]
MVISKKNLLAMASATLVALTLSTTATAHPEANPPMPFDPIQPEHCPQGHPMDGHPQKALPKSGHGPENHGDKKDSDGKPPAHREMNAENRDDVMQKRLSKTQRFLDLSDAQVVKLKALFIKHQPTPPEPPLSVLLRQRLGQLDPLADNYQAQVDTFISQQQQEIARHIQDQATFRKDLFQLLNPAQRKKLEAIQQNHPAPHEKHD